MSMDFYKFRDNLVSLEHLSPNLHQHYLEEMEKMFNQEITGVRKLGWWARDLGLLILGLALLGSALFNRPVELPTAGRWLWGLSGVFTIGIAVVELSIAWKKKMDLRKDSKLIANFGFVGLFVIANALLFVGFLYGNLKDLVTLAPMALLIIIIAILLVVHNRVQQGELNTREKLLEIEYRLAALDERLQK